MSERHSLYQHDNKFLEEHEKKYEEMRNEREKQRRDRMEQMERMMEMQQEEMMNKYKSHHQLKMNYVDPKEEERKQGLEKKDKVKRYIEETVKERYLPKINQEKRKEFMQMIEDMKKKKIRKVVKEDGSIEYEEVKPSDPRMVGLQYLEKTKEMAAKMRGRRKNSQQVVETGIEQPKVIDYLS